MATHALDTCDEVEGRVQPLVITTQIALDNTRTPAGEGQVTVDSPDGKAESTVQVHAMRCR